MNRLLFFLLLFSFSVANAQEVMTPELLWKLGRVSAMGISKDKKVGSVQRKHAKCRNQQK